MVCVSEVIFTVRLSDKGDQREESSAHDSRTLPSCYLVLGQAWSDCGLNNCAPCGQTVGVSNCAPQGNFVELGPTLIPITEEELTYPGSQSQ